MRTTRNWNVGTKLLYHKAIVICITIFFWNLSIAQNNGQSGQNGHLVPTVHSPNTASLGTYGDTPVDLFTGTPNISIPIYNLASGNINVPITLSYHPANVKPATIPGWVGFGWTLNPAGAITRSIIGYPDEQYIEGITSGRPNTYYPFPEESGLNDIVDNPPGADLLDNSLDWNEFGFLTSYLLNRTQTDILADKFTFNFLGYSGTFYYSGEAKGWEVISDQNIKVEFTGEFIAKEELVEIINEYAPTNELYSSRLGNRQSHQFSGFKITTPDGTQYEFGGHDGVELTSLYARSDVPFVINSWVLTKITDIHNNIVEFEYKRSYPTCQLNFGASSGEESFVDSSTFVSSEVSNFYHQDIPNLDNHLSGYYNWGLYLTNIKSATTEIDFSSDRAEAFTYTEEQLRFTIDKDGRSTRNNPEKLWLINDNGEELLENIKGEKLNQITVKNRYNIGGDSQVIHRFEYVDNPAQRLTLDSYYKQEAPTGEKKKYDFEYNRMDLFTPSCDGNYSDHWGYYNGADASGRSLSILYDLKVVNPYHSKLGLLTKMTFRHADIPHLHGKPMTMQKWLI